MVVLDTVVLVLWNYINSTSWQYSHFDYAKICIAENNQTLRGKAGSCLTQSQPLSATSFAFVLEPKAGSRCVGQPVVVEECPGCILFNGSTAAGLSARALCSPTGLCALALYLSSSQGRHKPDEALDLSQQSFTEQQKDELSVLLRTLFC